MMMRVKNGQTLPTIRPDIDVGQRQTDNVLPKGRWTNNTRSTKIFRGEGDQIICLYMFKILNGYENIDSNIFFSKLRKVK